MRSQERFSIRGHVQICIFEKITLQGSTWNGGVNSRGREASERFLQASR